MYFLALSQAPPALAEEIAIDTPEIKIPGNTPATAYGPKTQPTKNGVPMTIKAGKNISTKEALVAMAIHFSYSGFSVPFLIPGLSLNYLLTSLTIWRAAFPTDFMVKAEKAYGNIAPINNPEKIKGALTLTVYMGCLFKKLEALVI